MFVMVPSTKFSPVSLWLLIAHHIVHFASPQLWVLKVTEPHVLLVHKPIEVEMDFITKPQAV
jgi:hypothetical protein